MFAVMSVLAQTSQSPGCVSADAMQFDASTTGVGR